MPERLHCPCCDNTCLRDELSAEKYEFKRGFTWYYGQVCGVCIVELRQVGGIGKHSPVYTKRGGRGGEGIYRERETYSKTSHYDWRAERGQIQLVEG